VLLSQGILVSIVDISIEQLMLMLSYYYEEEGIANIHGRAVGHMIFLGSRMPTGLGPGSNIKKSVHLREESWLQPVIKRWII
jgi:hypothetical protein